MKRPIFLYCIAVATGLASCKDKDKDPEPDTTKPVITIQSPAEDDMYVLGDTLWFEASVTDNVSLNQVHVHVHNETADEHIIETTYTPAGGSFTFHLPYEVVQVDPTEFHFEIGATDDAGNTSETEVEIVANE